VAPPLISHICLLVMRAYVRLNAWGWASCLCLWTHRKLHWKLCLYTYISRDKLCSRILKYNIVNNGMILSFKTHRLFTSLVLNKLLSELITTKLQSSFPDCNYINPFRSLYLNIWHSISCNFPLIKFKID
jgi:hypothetical protein